MLYVIHFQVYRQRQIIFASQQQPTKCLKNSTIEDHIVLDMLGNGTKTTLVNMLHQKDRASPNQH